MITIRNVLKKEIKMIRYCVAKLKKIVQYLYHNPRAILKILIGQWPSDIAMREIYKILSNCPTIVEAGSGWGQHTEIFAKRYPNGRIIALEPIQILYDSVGQKIRPYNNVELLQIALAEEGKKWAKFYYDEQEVHEANSMLVPKKSLFTYNKSLHFRSITKVRCITLDELVNNKKIVKIDLLWLDTQGTELQILANGGKNSLAITQYIHVEIAESEMYEGAATREQIINYLESKGFSIVKIAMGIDYGNVLMKNQKFGTNI